MNDLTELLRLDLEARGDIWNETPPALAFLYQEANGWRLSDLNLPGFIWQPHPAAGLERMAGGMSYIFGTSSTIKKYADGARPAEWRGVAFFAEAWVVTHAKEGPDSEIDPVFLEMAKARMLSQHPGRVESRCWWAALDNGTSLAVIQERETGKIYDTSSEGTDQFEGTITDALMLMVKTLTRP